MNLTEYLLQSGVAQSLQALVGVLAEFAKQTSTYIETTSTGKSGTQNSFGEQQLALDVWTNDLAVRMLGESGLVSAMASEELDDVVIGQAGAPFAVCFDPLDGSSLVDVNFAVGSIFGVYEGAEFIRRKGDEMVASLCVVYGPRTTLLVTVKHGTHEFTLMNGEFVLTQENLQIAESGKVFAPGNLRACKSEPKYKALVDHWLMNEYTLRYSGGMVPDINHILLKGKGIFTYPGYVEAPAGKLRLLYECAPMSLLVEQAGGRATDGKMRILDKTVENLTQRTPILIGSSEEVKMAEGMLVDR